MKISIKVKPGAKANRVKKEKDSERVFTVWVKAPAKAGQANEAVVKILAEYFKVPQSYIKIMRGHASRQKIISVP